MVSTPLQSALAYARQGWQVFPLHSPVTDIGGLVCSCGEDCASPAKHPRTFRGLHDASGDEAQIKAWWSRWGDANVGLRTGEASGIVVVDVDSYHDGDDGLAELEATYGALPPTLTADTGGGGRHLVYAHPADLRVRNRAGLAAGVDLRGDGGYIVAPPSMHISGRCYAWRRPLAPVAALPLWLAEAKREPKAATGPLPAVPNASEHPWVQAALRGEVDELGRAMHGNRNHALNRAAFNLGQLVPHALSQGEVEGALEATARAIGLEESEIPGTLRSGLVDGMAEPRAIPERTMHLVGSKQTPKVIGENDLPGEPARPALEFVTIAELIDQVDNAEPVGWLVETVWPADAYGVIAAEQKAGKTWAVLDLVVSVAAGLRWMGHFDIDVAGPVVVFLGEGGKRKMLRRLRALAASKGIDLDGLPIELCFRVPHLTSKEHLAEVRRRVVETSPRLVVIDPLYLAAKGAKGSQLYEMGEHLEAVQYICQEASSALVIIHHWNKTGEGKGAKRMSGVGPGEWGRVLVSASVKTKHTDKATGCSTVLLDWTFEGDEIPDLELRTRRRVWADDQHDLASAMHYVVDVIEVERDEAGDAEHPGLTPSARRVLTVIEASDGTWLSVPSIGDVLADEGFPLKKRTIQQACKDLREAELIGGPGGPDGLAWSKRIDNEEDGE